MGLFLEAYENGVFVIYLLSKKERPWFKKVFVSKLIPQL
jgi:hypothetical protein